MKHVKKVSVAKAALLEDILIWWNGLEVIPSEGEGEGEGHHHCHKK
ncbi:MAG: hypothetical protein NTU83_12155 [Candidatus Hydrogenedentes bacterium]|nr:hypothetical protein [Candidatus Hydrogenedentota bacterium]